MLIALARRQPLRRGGPHRAVTRLVVAGALLAVTLAARAQEPETHVISLADIAEGVEMAEPGQGCALLFSLVRQGSSDPKAYVKAAACTRIHPDLRAPLDSMLGDRTDPLAALGRATLFLVDEDGPRAVGEATRAVRADPTLALGWLALCEGRIATGAGAKAAAACEQALALDASSELARTDLHTARLLAGAYTSLAASLDASAGRLVSATSPVPALAADDPALRSAADWDGVRDWLLSMARTPPAERGALLDEAAAAGWLNPARLDAMGALAFQEGRASGAMDALITGVWTEAAAAGGDRETALMAGTHGLMMLVDAAPTAETLGTLDRWIPLAGEGGPRVVATFRKLRGQLLVALQRPGDAMEELTAAYDLLEKDEVTIVLVESLLLRARAAHELGDEAGVDGFLAETHARIAVYRPAAKRGAALALEGATLRLLGRHAAAAAAFEAEASTFRWPHGGLARGRALAEAGKSRFDAGEFAPAATLLQRAARRCARYADAAGTARAYLALARVLHAVGSDAEAKQGAQAAMDLFLSVGEDDGEEEARSFAAMLP